jgi:predicted permease
METSFWEKLKSRWYLVVGVILLLLNLIIFGSSLKDYFLNSDKEFKSFKVMPVDQSKDIDRLSCYQHRIPQEVMDLCDRAFTE